METLSDNSARLTKYNGRRAFTLVEVLVVIGIISLLAALGFQGATIVTRKRDRVRVETQLEQLKLAIEDYKFRFGTYPPDATLYDELTANGVINSTNKPATIGSSRHPKNYLPNFTANDVYLDMSTGVRYLRIPVPDFGAGPYLWKYNSLSPSRNTTTYDIWAEFYDRGDTNNLITIGNWK